LTLDKKRQGKIEKDSCQYTTKTIIIITLASLSQQSLMPRKFTMPRHRFLEFVEVNTPLPRIRSGSITPGAFCACPIILLSRTGGMPAPWQVSLYQWAFAEAQAVVRPSIPERDLLANWN
jgi:hypothetical protein